MTFIRLITHNISNMGTTYTAKVLRKLAEKQGFILLRQQGSHAQYGHKDGRKTTIPMHDGIVPKGTANNIIKKISKNKGG